MNASLLAKRLLLALSIVVATGVLPRAQATDTYKPQVGQAGKDVVWVPSPQALQLRPTLLNLKPGTRVVSNTFTMEEWEPDQKITLGPAGCNTWCTAMLWIIPAKAHGTWKTPQGNLTITQTFQMISGTLGSTPITGKVTGDQISFAAATTQYTGRVDGDTIRGSNWTAARID